MIELDGVSRRFGPVEAVRELSFKVPGGAVCGFLGPNGAGKSTTIRIIAGALAPDRGRVIVGGIDLEADRGSALSQLGWLPEHAPLPAELRVEEMLVLRAQLLGVPRAERRTAIGEVIESCRLSEVRRRLCGQLSKGFRQRAGLAAALVHRPMVLVLDEPTSGLDPSQVDEFRSLVKGVAGRTTVLLSTHILAEVEAVCDRVLVIDRGTLLAERGAASTHASLEALYRGLMGGRLP